MHLRSKEFLAYALGLAIVQRRRPGYPWSMIFWKSLPKIDCQSIMEAADANVY